MTQYHPTITCDRYPTTYNVDGGSWQGAAAAAIRLWRKRFKGSRTTIMSIRLVKLPKGGEHHDR